MTPETQKENVQQYLEGIDYPASKDELFSTAESNDAPDNFFKRAEATKRTGAPQRTPAVSVRTGAEQGKRRGVARVPAQKGMTKREVSVG
jgi:uncharacterized protein DUF2795